MWYNTRKRKCHQLVTRELVMFLLVANTVSGSLRDILQVDMDQIEREINQCGYDYSNCNDGNLIGSATHNSYSTSSDIWPYLISFQRPTHAHDCFMHICSGILISPTTVMTSGTCIRMLNFLQYHTHDVKFFSKIISNTDKNIIDSDSNDFSWYIGYNSMYYLPSDVYVSNVPYCRNNAGYLGNQRIKTITMEILQNDDSQNHDFDVVLIHTQQKVRYDTTIYPYPSSSIWTGAVGWSAGWLNSQLEDVFLSRGYNQQSIQKGQITIMDLDTCKNIIQQYSLSVYWPDDEDHVFCGCAPDSVSGCSGGIGSPLIMENGYGGPSWDNIGYEFAGVLAEVPKELCNPQSYHDFFLGIYIRYFNSPPPPPVYDYYSLSDDDNEYEKNTKNDDGNKDGDYDQYTFQGQYTFQSEYTNPNIPIVEFVDDSGMQPPDYCDQTQQGCKCKESWQYNGQFYYGCQNPDNDNKGKWCFVTDDSIITEVLIKQTASRNKTAKYELYDYCLNEC